MKIFFYSLCVLLLLSCGQKGDLVRPESATKKLADALTTPSTTQDLTEIDVTYSLDPKADDLCQSEACKQ